MITTGGEGKVPPRKRLRGKIGNPSNAPELKSHNMLVTGEDDGLTFYTRRVVHGVYNSSPLGVWYPMPLVWPVVGTSAHQRIGNKIRVKLLRLKGMVSYSPYLITQVRYRIVLYRTKKIETYTYANFILPLYSASEDISTAVTVATRQNAVARNYYCSYFNREVMKDNDVKRRVLFKGLIKPQPDAPNFKLPAQVITSSIAPQTKNVTTTTTGKQIGDYYQVGQQYAPLGWFNAETMNQAEENLSLTSTTTLLQIPVTTTTGQMVFSGEFQKHYTYGQGEAGEVADPINNRGFFPLDISVTMNDNIDCTKYDYVIVVESDWGVGQDPQGTFDSDWAHANFFISFTPHIYYTDD